jgi:hypothetical protein
MQKYGMTDSRHAVLMQPHSTGEIETMTEERIVTTTNGSGADAAIGASTLIRTIVSSIVLLVLLGVGLYALHLYLGWF